MVPVTAESIGIAQLAELRQQQGELQRLGRNLLVKVPFGVEERLGEELIDALRPLREASRAVAGRLARSDEWLLQVILDAASGEAREGDKPAAARTQAVLDRLEELVAEVRGAPRPSERLASAMPPLESTPVSVAEPTLPELVGRARTLVGTLDARVGEALLRVRDMLRRLTSGRRPNHDDLEAGSRLLLEAQGNLQQAKAATSRLADRLERLAAAELDKGGGGGLIDGLQNELVTLGQELRHTMLLLDAGTGGAQERLAQAAGKLNMHRAG
jgi:hypothetical protein